MRYTVDHVDDTATVFLHTERLDASNSSDFKGELVVLCRSGINVLFIDLSEVMYCDSTGLSALLLAHRELRATGGYSILINLSPKVASLIELARLDTVLFIYESREDALKDLKGTEEEDEDF